MEMLKTILVSALCSVVSVAAYDQFIAVKPTPVAVANYDMALSVMEDPNEALASLRANAQILAAEGYVVVDSRALLGYPGDVEIPEEALKNSTPAPQGNPVPPGVAQELEGADE